MSFTARIQTVKWFVVLEPVQKVVGVAGNHQWGLDVGIHQDGWYPWTCDGPEGEKQMRQGNESELEVSPFRLSLAKLN